MLAPWRISEIKALAFPYCTAYITGKTPCESGRHIYKEVYNCIKHGKIFEINAKEALKYLNIVLAAYKSAITNQPVDMHDFSFSLRDVASYLDNLQTK